ncbi:MAG: AAA family ATPase [Thermoguttaceae bacterium]
MNTAKMPEEQIEFVRKQIIQSEIPRDSLPYHPKFDELYHAYLKEDFSELSEDEYWQLLLRVGKKGNARQSDSASLPAVPASEAEKYWIRHVLKDSLGKRDRLPYTKDFDDVYDQFREHTNREISKNDFWRLLSTIAKSSIRIKHLPSLSIQNYRSLDGLQIERLGQVNLIVGPNNIGKSSLLEAILIWGTKRHFLTIRDILRSRDECNVDFPDQFQVAPYFGIHHLFTGFPELSGQTPPITISTVDGRNTVSLELADAPRDAATLAPGPLVTFDLYNDPKRPYGLLIGGSLEFARNGEAQFVHYLEQKCLYLSPCIINAAKMPASKLWEQVEISGRETAVLDSLRLIDTRIEKIFFIGSNPRIPVCRIKGLDRPVPLHNLGDGVSRLFELILGIVNVAGGICLIDEFENGLHWSVHEQVWDVVFQTAQKLDVQIFATTHSLETLKAFQQAAFKQESEECGVVLQMRRRKGRTTVQLIIGDDLHSVLQFGIEVR